MPIVLIEWIKLHWEDWRFQRKLLANFKEPLVISWVLLSKRRSVEEKIYIFFGEVQGETCVPKKQNRLIERRSMWSKFMNRWREEETFEKTAKRSLKLEEMNDSLMTLVKLLSRCDVRFNNVLGPSNYDIKNRNQTFIVPKSTGWKQFKNFFSFNCCLAGFHPSLPNDWITNLFFFQ